jgi:hypothetical protein
VEAHEGMLGSSLAQQPRCHYVAMEQIAARLMDQSPLDEKLGQWDPLSQALQQDTRRRLCLRRRPKHRLGLKLPRLGRRWTTCRVWGYTMAQD